MEFSMAMDGLNAHVQNTTKDQHRFSWLFSGIALRLLIAFLISWIVLLAFFVSGVVSH
jgi:hypothetical protein